MKELAFAITSNGWGGLEINVLKLAQWLSERGWKIKLYTIEKSKIYTEAVHRSIPVYVINDHKKYFDFSAAYKFSRILKHDKVHSIMIFDNKDLDFIFLTKKMMSGKLRVIYQQHMQIGVRKTDFLHTLRFSAIDEWISPLNFLKKEAEEKTNVKPEKIKVIPLGTEIGRFTQPKYSKEEARKKLGVDSSLTILGIAGRIDPKKGQLFLIKAIEELQTKYDKLALLIVGSPTVNDLKSREYSDKIRQYVSEHKLNDKVIFAGHTDDIQLFYNAVDIFALATEGETYGMVTIEAMLSDLPVIATNSGGTPEILDYGKLGKLYTPGDLKDFCVKLEDMLQNPERISEVAFRAKEYAVQRFSHELECDMIEELLR